jgi:pimeloyl-ACP methyl ester carboxylesterase
MPNLIRVPVAGAELIVESFGAGPTLIFAHGLTGNRQSTKRQFLSLAPQYRIVTYDQRGHGDSTPVTDPAGYDPAVMAADMGAVMDALGIARAIVGGESMGAATALIFALRHPERVTRLLLTAPAFGDRPNTEIGRFLDLADAIETYGMARFLEAAAGAWRNDFHWPPEVVASVGATFRAHGCPMPTSLSFRRCPPSFRTPKPWVKPTHVSWMRARQLELLIDNANRLRTTSLKTLSFQEGVDCTSDRNGKR